MLVDEPPQETARLVELALGDRPVMGAELIDQRLGQAPHRLPVLDRDADLSKHPFDVPVQLVEQVRIGLPVELDVDDRLATGTGSGPTVLRGVCRSLNRVAVGIEHRDQRAGGVADDPDHRMDRQLRAVPVPRKLDPDGVHEERHVIGHDLHDRVRRLPAVLLEIRVVDANPRLTDRALLREVPVGDRGPVQIERAAFDQIFGRHPVVVLADERGARLGLLERQTLVHPSEHGADQICFEFPRFHCEDQPTPPGPTAALIST